MDEPDEEYTKEEIAILWMAYRIGKQYACMGDICEKIAAHNMTGRDEVIVEIKEDEARQGAGVWLESVDIPRGWAERELY